MAVALFWLTLHGRVGQHGDEKALCLRRQMSDKVNFLGIGAPRSGTTWLHFRLREHPDFFLPRMKELHYFDRSKEYLSPDTLAEDRLATRLKDTDWRKKAIAACWFFLKQGRIAELRWTVKYYFSNYGDQWYLSLFDGADGICGEITPSYMLLQEKDIKRIFDLLPNVKTIFFMRDPVERTWSGFRRNYSRQKDKFPDDQSIIEYLDRPASIQRISYLETLERYQKHAQPGNMLVSFLDAIEQQPLATLQEIVTFLGGDTAKIDQHCDVDGVVNASASLDMPAAVRAHLCSKYHDLIQELSDRFGGYCTQWMNNHYGTNVNVDAVCPTLVFND